MGNYDSTAPPEVPPPLGPFGDYTKKPKIYHAHLMMLHDVTDSSDRFAEKHDVWLRDSYEFFIASEDSLAIGHAQLEKRKARGNPEDIRWIKIATAESTASFEDASRKLKERLQKI
jgi:hypothetical protein